jgi:hypothetical protein
LIAAHWSPHAQQPPFSRHANQIFRFCHPRRCLQATARTAANRIIAQHVTSPTHRPLFHFLPSPPPRVSLFQPA